MGWMGWRRPTAIGGYRAAFEKEALRWVFGVHRVLPSQAAAVMDLPAAGSASQPALASWSPDGDLVVRDNLGQPVPICAAEVAVVETYLGDALEELFASSKANSEPERA